jgi:predicted DNA-binding antitoxin AbrB/MazE fold protein
MPMETLQAFYDGRAFVPSKPVDFLQGTRVLITVRAEPEPAAKTVETPDLGTPTEPRHLLDGLGEGPALDIQERLAAAKRLVGILKGRDLDLEKVRMERLARQ